VGHITVCQSLVHNFKHLLNFVTRIVVQQRKKMQGLKCRTWGVSLTPKGLVGSQKNIMAELIILAREHVILQLDIALIYDTMLCTKVFYWINIFHT